VPRPLLTRATATLALGTVLAATVVTLSLGYTLKQPCAAGDWSNGRQYRQLCYSDVVALYGSEQLQGGRLPYLDACRAADGTPPAQMQRVLLALACVSRAAQRRELRVEPWWRKNGCPTRGC